MQIARYAGEGSHYLPHIDNADGDGRHGYDFGRVLTLIYYLNDMAAGDGGVLRLHLPPELVRAEHAVGVAVGREHWESHTAAVDMVPRAGLLVAFRSDRVAHEVRPLTGTRPRMACTVWLLAK